MASGSSLTQLVYEKLRADVLACRLRPGVKIGIGGLCKAHKVSLGAVREALSRLTAEGLITLEPQRGFRVAPVSEDDLGQLTDARVEIERLCLSHSILAGDVAWESKLVAALHELSRTPERVSDDSERLSEDWARAHAQYHQALVDACDNAWLLRMRSYLYAQSERYRRLSIPLASVGRDLEREHRAIMEAALLRRVDDACELMKIHLTATTSILLDSGALQKATGASVAA